MARVFLSSHCPKFPLPTLSFACNNNPPRSRACWRTVCFILVAVCSISLSCSLIRLTNSGSLSLDGTAAEGVISVLGIAFLSCAPTSAAGGLHDDKQQLTLADEFDLSIQKPERQSTPQRRQGDSGLIGHSEQTLDQGPTHEVVRW